MNEQERKEFERWYEGHCLPGEADWFRRDPDEPDEYKHGHTSEAWAGWQARAALAAKVPADNSTSRMAVRKVLQHHGLTEHGDGVVEADLIAAMLAATPAPAPEADKKNEWRELALKFDGQRMAALSHLRMLLEHGEAHAEAVRKFLAEPPQAASAPEADLLCRLMAHGAVHHTGDDERLTCTQEQAAKAMLDVLGFDVEWAAPATEAKPKAIKTIHGLPGLIPALQATEPAQAQQPLGEAQLEAAYREIWRNKPAHFGFTTSDWITAGIRYAERAHGIGASGEASK